MPLVTFLGELRHAAGRSEVEVEAGTVSQLLAAMGAATNPRLAGLLVKDREVLPDVEVLVNGRNIDFLERLETPLRPADQVTIFYSGVRGFPGGQRKPSASSGQPSAGRGAGFRSGLAEAER